MHHVPYTYTLRSGDTVVQHVYDSHYKGADEAMQLITEWQQLEHSIDAERYQKVLALQRAAITRWFAEESGIADVRGRVGNYPARIEAESMQLKGYQVKDITPFEMASGSKAVICNQQRCSANSMSNKPAGKYRISVAYYDFLHGVSLYTLMLNGKTIGHWAADGNLPADTVSGTTATRWTHWTPMELKPGDTLTLTAQPDGSEPAPVDYIELAPAKQVDITKP